MSQWVDWINATRNGADTSSGLKWWQSLTRRIRETSKIWLILSISLGHHVQRRTRIRSCTTVFFSGLVLEIQWIVRLVVQESLALKEVFPPLEGRLLLHLLERISSATIIAHLLLLLISSTCGTIIGILVFQADSAI